MKPLKMAVADQCKFDHQSAARCAISYPKLSSEHYDDRHILRD